MPREKSALETGFSRWGRGSGVSTQAGVSGEALGSAQRGQLVVGADDISDLGSGRR